MTIIALDRRQALRWIGRTSIGLAGLRFLGGCGDTSGTTAFDAAVFDDAAQPGVCPPTTSDVLGPFYREGAPSRMAIASPTEPGERLVLEGAIVGPDCAPLVGATLDFWQADKDGRYYDPNESEPYRLRGKVTSASDGTWAISTIRPGNYRLGADAWRPAHIHVTASYPGRRSVTTQLYFEGDPYLPPNDGCTTCGSWDAARHLRVVGARAELEIALA